MGTLGLSGLLFLLCIVLALIGIKSEIKALRQLLKKHWSDSVRSEEGRKSG